MQKECDPAFWFTHNGGLVPTWQRDGESLPVANIIPTLILIPVKVYQIGWKKKQKTKEVARPLAELPNSGPLSQRPGSLVPPRAGRPNG